MLRVATATGSARPGRNKEAVARWVHRLAKQPKEAGFELVAVADRNLTLGSEPRRVGDVAVVE